MSTNLRSKEEVLRARAEMPKNVVTRAFVKETIVLNLDTGKYHGLNPVGGHMLEVVTASPTLGAAAHLLAKEYGHPLEEVAGDLCDFCLQLEGRGLIGIVYPT